jgi:putative hemolysin
MTSKFRNLSSDIITFPVTEVQYTTRFSVYLARTADEIRESQQLRYQVFVGEMGAQISSDEAEIDIDHYDGYCDHLLVREVATGQLVASTRLLGDRQALCAGGFYSANEFDISMLDQLVGRKLEIGRTCVAVEFRNGAVIAQLWGGLARFVQSEGYDYLFGCVSMDMTDEGALAQALYSEAQRKYSVADGLTVQPHNPLSIVAPYISNERLRMPPLLKAYFSLGAKVCGAPCWDKTFNCADMFLLLRVSDMQSRYARHFKIEQTTSVMI